MVEGRLRDQDFLSPCASVFLLKAHLLMFPSPPETPTLTLQAAAETYKWLTAMRSGSTGCMDPRGYLDQTFDEKAITALLVSKLTKAMATCSGYNDRYEVMHQSRAVSNNDSYYGYLDMGVYYELPSRSTTRREVGELLPFVFMKFTRSDENLKGTQSMVYASYLLQRQQRQGAADSLENTPFPLLGFIVGVNRFICTMYHLTVVNNEYRVNATIVHEDRVDAEFFATLARVSVDYVAFCVDVEQRGLSYNRRPRKRSNIVLLDEYVYKAYDYRFSSANRSLNFLGHRRSPAGYHMSTLQVECVIDRSDPLIGTDGQLQIIRYKYKEGSHIPTVVKQLADIVRELTILHSQNYVHGDMRLANCVFVSGNDERTASMPGMSAGAVALTTSKLGFLIDFDYAGVMQHTHLYPVGFNESLPDVQRHPDAKEGQPIRSEHDWFSLASIFDLFRPADAALVDEWKTATAEVKCGNHEAALSILETMADKTLMNVRDPFNPESGDTERDRR